VLIRGPDMQSVCRLVLDAYSGTLYSSSPGVFAAIEDYVHRGYKMAEAIEAVALPPEVQQFAEAAE
jgi:conjugal transfer ATP-binding protein TraC